MKLVLITIIIQLAYCVWEIYVHELYDAASCSNWIGLNSGSTLSSLVSINSKCTPQSPVFMAEGKDQVWRTINLPTNRKYSAIKITFDCYFIDYWSKDRFLVYLNNQIMTDETLDFLTKSSPTPIYYCMLVGGGDQADSHVGNYEYQVDFTDSKVSIEISRFGLPLTRIFGLSNFYLYVQFCDENCDVCDNLGKCKQCSDGFSIVNDQCTCAYGEYSEVYYKFYNPTLQCVQSCPTGYVPDFEKTCQPGTSNLLFQDLYSTSFTNYLFSIQKDKYYTNNTNDFRIFTVNSQSVAGPFQYNEKLLYTPLSINPNSNILVKLKIYIILFTGSYQVGGYMKMRFNNYPVFEFRDFDSAQGLPIVGQYVINGYQKCTYGTELYICHHMDIEFKTFIDYEITSIMLDGQFTIVAPYRAWGIRDFAIYQQSTTGTIQICQSPCQSCIYNSTSICTSCVTGYYLFDTKCLNQCPSQTTLIGSICNEDTITYPISYALNICYDDGDYQDIIDSIQISIQDVNMSKYWHGLKYYSMIGGFNRWSYQILQYNIQTYYQFYRAYIKLSIVCFDCSCISTSGTLFQINAHNVICADLISVGNIIGQPAVEKQGEVYIVLGPFASKNQLQITFQKASTSPPQDNYGIYNLRVLVVKCPQFCTACDSTGLCLTWLVDASVLNGNCASGYYYESNTQTCQKCITSCLTCTSYNKCDFCKPGFTLYGGGCYCGSVQKESLSSCSISSSQCQTGCLVCGEDQQVNVLFQQQGQQVCVICDESKHLWLDIYSCKCIQGYYMDGDICQSCSPYCKACDKQPRICIDCDTTLNRELHYQFCDCKQGYYEEDNNLQCSLCDITCNTCRFFNDYCTSCHPDQHRTVLNRMCICQDGYYEEGIAICSKCDQKCQTCSNLTDCLSCYSMQNRKLSLVNNKCICQVGYFEVENQLFCDHCYYACQECQPSPLQNMCTRCPQSRKPSIIDTVFSCICKRGYYESNMKECSDCRFYLNPPSTHYCYSKCGDNHIQWNEDCDNGSTTLTINGCYQCLFTNSYCFNQLCTKCEMGICIQCIDGFYLTKDSICEQCDQSCKTCSTRSDNCNTCTITTSTGSCLMCQTSQGFKIINNECINICGDGLKVKGELCDDGNDKSGDGCYNCIVEDGWICDILCERIIYPQILFTPNVYDYQYNGIRNIIVYTSIPLKVKGQITDLCTFTLDDELAIINENNDMTNYLEDYNILQIQLKVTLKKRNDTPTLICKIKNSHQFISQQGFTFNQTKFETVLLAYKLQSESVINATQGLMSLSQYILYILLGLAILAFLFGGLDIFWNLLDVLQLLSYLQFFNVIYPYNVDTYFQLFGFAQFDFIQNIVDIGTLINDYVDSPDPDYKFAEQGYSTTFFINGTTLFTAFILTFLTYLGCRFGFVLLSKILQYYTNDEDTSLEEEPNVIKFILFRIFRNVERMLLKIMGEFRSGLIRTFMAITYDYNLAIFLQIKEINTNNSVLCASFIITLFFLCMQCYFLFKGFTLMSKQPYYYEQFYVEQKYGSLYEGVHIRASSPFSNYYNMILLLKKILFIIFLVNLYSVPSLQILMCSFLNIIFITYIVYNRPLEEKQEFIKTIGSEILIWIAELLILLLYYLQQNEFDSQQQLMVGWFIIVDCTLLILFQLVLDVKQHFEYLVREFKIISRLFYRIQILLGRQPEPIDTEENLVDIQRSKSTIKSKSSNTLLKQRKLVTFRIDT